MDHVNWGRLCLAIVAAAVAGSITDWLFFGMLFHDKYLVYPEVWKKREEGGAGGQIAQASIVGLIASAALIVLCVGLHVETYRAALKLAAAVWFVASVPVIANDHIFMKLHPALFVSHAVGYLVRFMIAVAVYVAIGR